MTAPSSASLLSSVPMAPKDPILGEKRPTAPPQVTFSERATIELGGTLVELFEAQAHRTPDAPAVTCDGRTLTYAELNALADVVATRLVTEHSAGAEAIVGLRMARSIEMVAGILGTLKAGAGYLPLDPTYPPERLAFMVEDSQAVVTLTSDDIGGAPGARRRRAVLPAQTAYVIYTSGSTGMPKAVINTQRMLCSNLQQIGQCFPCLGDKPPVFVDWLPWNHVFGGNHNFGLVLYNGGTLYIDDGRPVPGLVEKTVQNLREISPTIYFSVPRGYDALLPFLREDKALRDSFFRRLELLQYAAAVLPQPTWKAYEDLAAQACGERVQWITGYGATETAPETAPPDAAASEAAATASATLAGTGSGNGKGESLMIRTCAFSSRGGSVPGRGNPTTETF